MGQDSPIVLPSGSEEGEQPEGFIEKVKEDGEDLTEPPDWLPDGWIMEVRCGEDGSFYQDGEDLTEPPDWLPDGWIMEVRRGEDGSFYHYFISPMTGARFRMKAEVLSYLFSDMEEQFLESKKCAARNTLHSTHQWLSNGWLIEIRAGGENMEKMFKFYIYPAMGIRVLSKEDVLLYAKDMVVAACDTEGQCDTSSEDNILAQVELNPSMLPEGWVKEIVYRKTKTGIRKDPYFTEPVSHYVFRTLKSAMRYLQTRKVSSHSCIQKTSVHDLYNFDKCADLHKFLRKRLTKNWKTNKTPKRSSSPKENEDCNDQTSDRFDGGESSTNFPSTRELHESKKKRRKTEEKEPYSDKIIKRPTNKSQREGTAKQTNGDTTGNLRKSNGSIKQGSSGKLSK